MEPEYRQTTSFIDYSIEAGILLGEPEYTIVQEARISMLVYGGTELHCPRDT